MPGSSPATPTPWLRRIGWLALIWASSVIALGVIALLFHMLMGAAGLTA